MKKGLSLSVGAAVSAVLLWLAVRQADISSVGSLLGGLKTKHVLLVMATVMAELTLRGIKWAMLLNGGKPVRIWDTLRLAAVGLGLNNILPLRAGEIARTGMAAALFRVNILTVASTIFIEKILDAAALTALGVLAAAAAGTLPTRQQIPGSPAVWAAGVVVFVLLVAVSLRGGESAWLKNFRTRVAQGFKAIRSPYSALMLFMLALAQWGLNSLNYFWLGNAFSNEITLARSALLSAAGAASSSVPGIPGYFGSFELAVSATLRLWGMGADSAFAYAATAHLLPYLVTTAAGLISLWLMGYSFAQIREKQYE